MVALALALTVAAFASGVRLQPDWEIRLKADPTYILNAETTEILTAVQIHGNVATNDDEIRRMAGLQIGALIEPNAIEVVAARLRATRRFERVEVLKRFASIADPSQIVLVIIVDEGPVHIELTGDPSKPTRVARTRGPNFLYLPIISSEDGYGLTYGVRLALPDAAGPHTRLSFPLTYGGEKKAAMEFEKIFTRAPVNRLLAGAAVLQRTNPFFQEDDGRRNIWLRVEREVVHGVRVGGSTGWDHVSFGGVDESFARAGADVVFDTRLDAVLPRNAVYARTSWDHLSFPGETAERLELEARGYIGIVAQNILVLRVLRDDSTVPLPSYLRPMLGGMDTVRGFKAGTAIGDTLLSTSAEIIIPLTSPLRFGKFGVSVFTDSATVYNKGDRLRDQDWRRGYGGSIWFAAAIVRLSVAAAHGVGGPPGADGRASSTRVHVGGTISF